MHYEIALSRVFVLSNHLHERYMLEIELEYKELHSDREKISK